MPPFFPASGGTLSLTRIEISYPLVTEEAGLSLAQKPSFPKFGKSQTHSRKNRDLAVDIIFLNVLFYL